jgi:hypothetical protein
LEAIMRGPTGELTRRRNFFFLLPFSFCLWLTLPRLASNDLFGAVRLHSVLLGGRSDANLAPVRKSVEARRKSKLFFAGAVRIDQNELELTASPYPPVEHDLLSIG